MKIKTIQLAAQKLDDLITQFSTYQKQKIATNDKLVEKLILDSSQRAIDAEEAKYLSPYYYDETAEVSEDE